MIAYTDPYIERARRLLRTGNHEDRKYAALELRFAIEEVAYKKLAMRIKKIFPGEINNWQPGRVIKLLTELVDPHIKSDSQLFVGVEDEYGQQPSEMNFIGRTKGLDYNKLEKHWHKLGSYLHRKFPEIDSKGRVETTDSSISEQYAEEVISFIEEVSTHFDVFMSTCVNFTCTYCRDPIIKLESTVQDGSRVRCQNPNCGLEFVITKHQEQFSAKPNEYFFPCEGCGEPIRINSVDLQKVTINFPISTRVAATCDHCQCEHHLCWVLMHARTHEIDLDSLTWTCSFEQLENPI